MSSPNLISFHKSTSSDNFTECSSTDSTATFNRNKVTAIVIGAGPIGLSVARQLEGLEYIHNKSLCKKLNLHAVVADGERVFRQQIPPTLPAGRGKYASGCWFDSFMYEQDRSASCLLWQENDRRKVDWLLISNSQPGGSWNNYHPNQKSFSPDTWMALPDDPISEEKQHLTRERICDSFYKIDAASLCKYYQEYTRQLPRDRMQFDCTVNSAYQQDNLWHLQVSRQGHITRHSSKYLVLANGRTIPGLLGIDGEQLEHVSHTTAEAIRKTEQLQTGASILVIGTGLSAAETIIYARKKGLKVTHILPEKHTRLEVKYRLGKSKNTLNSLHPSFYPEHFELAEYISGFRSSPDYQQLIDYQLLNIHSDRTCTLTSESTSSVNQCCLKQGQFDHYVILIGAVPDFSFLQDKDRHPLKLNSGSCLTGVNVVPETMEVKNINNLFLAGSCAGEVFQRYSLGHSVSIAETIKEREQRHES